MSQFSSASVNLARNIGDAPDPSARTQFKRNTQLNEKKQQTQGRIASGGSRTSLRDRRDLALINQGVDPQELRSGIRQDRSSFNRLIRESRRAFQSGDTQTGEALRAQAENLRYDINDRFKIARSTPRDLPPEEQVARREASRAQLNAQIPAIAQAASGTASAAQSRQINNLANIGRQAYALENGSPPPAGTSPAALAEYARSIAGPEAVAAVTRGVGLPADRSVQANEALASRAGSLAESGGVQFPEFTPQQPNTDPAVAARVRDRQLDRAVNTETGRQISSNARALSLAQSSGAVLAAQNATERESQVTPAVTARDRAIAQAETATAEGRESNQNAQNELDAIAGQRAIERAQGRRVDTGSVVDRAGVDVTDSNIESIQSLTQGIPRMIERIAGDASSTKTATEIKKALDEVGTLALRPDMTPEQKAVFARNMLDRIEASIGQKKNLVREGVTSLFLRSLVRGGNIAGMGPSDSTIEQNADFAEMVNMLRQMAGEA